MSDPGKDLLLNDNSAEQPAQELHDGIPPAPRFYVIHHCQLPKHDWSVYETEEEATRSLRIRRLKISDTRCLSTCHVAKEL